MRQDKVAPESSVVDETFLIGYEAPCPTCRNVMIEPFDRIATRKDGIIVLECPVHGLFHFRPADGTEAKLIAAEPPEA